MTSAFDRNNGKTTMNGSLPTDPSIIAMTTVFNRGAKGTEASSTKSRPHSGKPSVSTTHGFGGSKRFAGGNPSTISNTLFHIEMNQSSKGQLLSESSPRKVHVAPSTTTEQRKR